MSKSCFYGFLFFAVTPLVALFFLITVIGIPVGIFVAAMYVFSIVFAKPIAALTFARALEIWWKKGWGKIWIFLLSLVLYIALKILSVIPVIGWLVVVVAVFFAFGALLATKWAKWEKVR